MAVLIPVARLMALCDPFTNPWGSGRFTVKDVRASLERGKLLSERYPENGSWSRQQHIARIAWLVTHGWDEPLVMDIGVPSLGCYVRWPLLDGNHRLAAAVVRGDEEILASVGGAIDYAFELFGVDITEGDNVLLAA